MHDPHPSRDPSPPADGGQEGTRPAPVKPARRPAKKICLLGDNALLVRDTALQLQSFGHEIMVVTRLDQLALLLNQQPLNGIVVDASKRDSSFSDPSWATKIRALCVAPIPILWLSPRNDFETRLAAARAGVDAYFAKPVDMGALRECLDAFTPPSEKVPYRVLVVGSEAARLARLTGVLAEAGMQTMTLQKPLDLIGTLSHHHPELVVMDVNTPACNGVDLAALVRQGQAYVDLPLLVLSEDPDPALRRRAVATGVDDYLVAPLPDDELVHSISARIERSRTLRSLITRDGLTGLYNHNAVKEHLTREIARSKRDGTRLALAMVDLDFFKKINDTYGHPVGDQVIRAISRTLRQRLRKGDVIGRYGGEEFVVILPGTSSAAAADILNEIRETFSRLSHRAEDVDFYATFSAGVAELADATEPADAAELFRIADAALYQAKQGGRNQVTRAQGT